MLLPAGASPADRFGTRFDGRSHDDFLSVLVDGTSVVAGVSSDRAEMGAALHAKYFLTQSYIALTYARLLLAEISNIDGLANGLPVSQASNPERCKQLEAEFIGKN